MSADWTAVLLAQADPLQFPPEMPGWIWAIVAVAGAVVIGSMVAACLFMQATRGQRGLARGLLLWRPLAPGTLAAFVLVAILVYYCWWKPVQGLLSE